MNKDTIKCISIAEKPGALGVTFHNRGYKALGLNYSYMPLKVMPSQLESVISLLRDNFHGCSVSMPHKVKIMEYLDELDNSASKIGAVNTILNKNGILIGYNTDYYGAKRAIETSLDIREKEVVMIGAGGVARAMGNAVKDLGGKLIIANRTEEKAIDLTCILSVPYILFKNLNKVSGYLLINATNVGMNNNEDVIVPQDIISKFDAVMDVVIPKEGKTRLINEVIRADKRYITGRTMAAYQAAEQFRLYTEKELPEEFIQNFLN